MPSSRSSRRSNGRRGLQASTPRLLLAGALALGVGGGCGANEEGAATTAVQSGSTATEAEQVAANGDAPATDQVEIVDFRFDPPTITVPAGTEVSWTNRDAAAHTATAEDGSFDSGTLKKGDDGAVALDEPGSYEYLCEFHPFMEGTVEVE